MNFKYFDIDLSNHFDTQICTEIINYCKKYSTLKKIKPHSVTSREKDIDFIDTYLVDGISIRKDLVILFEWYENAIYEYAKKFSGEEVFLAKNDLYAVNLNVQIGSEMRYECHVDSNPIQGVLYITTNVGGELVVSKTSVAQGIAEIEQNSHVFESKRGRLLIFDGRKSPHYARPLKNNDDIRIAVTMNYYTTSSPEENRPDDLSLHLGLE